jgi:hypothetical protein
MEGGNALQVQSLDKKPVIALMEKIRSGEIKKSCDAITHLVNSGFSQETAGNVLKVIMNKFLGDIVMAENDDANDVFESSTDELVKAIANLEGGGEDTLVKGLSKMKDDGEYKVKGGHAYMKKAGKWEKVDDDSPDYNGDDDDDDMGKSMVDLGDDVVDATEVIESMEKSIKELKTENSGMKVMLKGIQETLEKQSALMKSIGTTTLEDSKMIKSMAGAPLPRQTTNGKIEVQERFSKSMVEKLATVTVDSMVKSMAANNVDENMRASVLHTHRKQGIVGVAKAYPQIAEMFVKEV